MSALWLGLLLAGGCAVRGTPPAAATKGMPPTLQPTEIPSVGDALETLVAYRTDSPPAIDGEIEDLWATAAPLFVRMTWGQSDEPAWDVELRSLYTGHAVFFAARWPGAPPPGGESIVLNKLTLHWTVPEPAAQHLDCTVVCHTASADQQGRVVYANAETIPQGGSEMLPAAGGWQDGTWTLEWSRPLSSANPYDLQFSDLGQTYPFRIKIFEHIQDHPDAISPQHALVFLP